MQCKHHPDRKAVHLCSGCNAPLCQDCAEEIQDGVYTCFQCAMLQSVSQVGTGLSEKRAKAAEKEAKKGKKWGPFQFFIAVSGVLILVMWAVIIFGGQKAPSQASMSIEKGKATRVFLFLVDGALKRYAHYEGSQYPERLADLVPKYLQIRKDQIPLLDNFSYVRDRDPRAGYDLSVADAEDGEMQVILTPQGLKYKQPEGGTSG